MKRIAVLMGGWSSEREVSLKSGRNISDVLRGMGYDVFDIDVVKDLRYITDELYNAAPDFVFNALHGTGGEDGVIQGILDVFGVPYSNSGVLASAVSFDKSICKKIVSAEGVRVAYGIDIDKSDIKKIRNGIDFEYPFVVKPSANGSSVGVFLVFEDSDLDALNKTEWTFGDKVLVERYIGGREFTVLVLNGKAIGAIEITHKNKFYDYQSKYEIGGSSHLSSFEMNESAYAQMLVMAEKVFSVCGCDGIARVDFRYDDEAVYFMEINTQPGMTELSLAPDIARFNGISFEELLQMNWANIAEL